MEKSVTKLKIATKLKKKNTSASIKKINTSSLNYLYGSNNYVIVGLTKTDLSPQNFLSYNASYLNQHSIDIFVDSIIKNKSNLYKYINNSSLQYIDEENEPSERLIKLSKFKSLTVNKDAPFQFNSMVNIFLDKYSSKIPLEKRFLFETKIKEMSLGGVYSKSALHDYLIDLYQSLNIRSNPSITEKRIKKITNGKNKKKLLFLPSNNVTNIANQLDILNKTYQSLILTHSKKLVIENKALKEEKNSQTKNLIPHIPVVLFDEFHN